MSLLTELLKHKNSNNENLVNELIECIESENINSKEDLQILENRYFTINGKLLNDKEKIQYCVLSMANYHCDYDNLSIEEINLFSQLKKSLTSEIDIKNKLLSR